MYPPTPSETEATTAVRLHRRHCHEPPFVADDVSERWIYRAGMLPIRLGTLVAH
ncbi:hypothetical protein LPJ71_011408, partial [Coemansia sp. S17]